MPRHFTSKSDYRRYVKKCHERAGIFTHKINGNSCCTSSRSKFQPKIDSERDYFNSKYQNVVRGYQNLVVMNEYCSRSQEEWRWLHYQGVRMSRSFAKVCKTFEKTTISNEVKAHEKGTMMRNPFLKLDMGGSKPNLYDLNSKRREEKAEERHNLAEISDPFGHNSLYAHLEPVTGTVNVPPFDIKVLKFSGNGQVNSFLDFIMKG